MKSPTREVFERFLKLGLFGFGGPLALVAQMQRDLVERDQWIPHEEFQRVFTLIKAMPGAVGVNTAVYLGRRRAGWKGGAVAALGLIGPAAILVIAISFVYDDLRGGPFNHFLIGLQAAALGLVLAALKPLAGAQARDTRFWFLGLIAAVIFARDWIPEPLLIVGGGAAWVLWRWRPKALFSFVWGPASMIVLWQIALICTEAGAFVFGSGVAIAPLLERDFVTEMGWVTRPEFMDALAIGQATPGPFLITATFLGYKVAGLAGAIVATFCVFGVGILHMLTWFPSAVNRLSRLRWLPDFLFGAFAMVCGTIVWTVISLASVWTTRPAVYAILFAVFGLTVWRKWPSWLLILSGGGAGILLHFAGL